MDRALWIQFWKTFPFLAIFPIVLFALAYRWGIAEIHRDLERDQHTAVEAAAVATARRLNGIAAVTLMLRDQNELTNYLATGDRRLLGQIAREYLNVARYARTYDDLHFIDAQGKELVRVNFNDGDPSVVPEAELQDKSGRPYFADTMAHGYGEVCVTPMDLNIERGEVERPYKPVIHLGTPLFDAQGRKRGIVIVDYLGQILLDIAKTAMAHAPGETMMLNREGYWLLSADPGRAWGFMFPGHEDQRMGILYPAVWAAMQQAEAGHLYTEDGLFTFFDSDPLKPQYHPIAEATGDPEALHGHGGHRWYFVVHLPQAQLEAMRIKALVVIASIGIFVVMLLAAAYQKILIDQNARRIRRTQLERRAQVDTLTGIANRAAFEEQLAQEHERAGRWRHEHRFALLYIDLDGFKAINDQLGHHMGDQVLKDVADTLTRNSRKGDAVGRYGGDEFVVMLADVPDVQTAVAIAEKLRARIAAWSWSGFRVGASIGVAVYPDHAKRLGELVRLADEAMYISKTEGKGRVTVSTGHPHH
ncbi:diguanylate cyclase (GGDEF) domain-containing protein [Thioflavicoccus mobilis 8321]|uniref:Diguanylate cyclase (GGDEF) domain-containing protein n=1 Tax=Thioflavicoccus mobilis 8321 TaxID=765912 RepID=L0H1E1_9GAMM|nr:sensor domain-containing diguanylate cyclase [Thioflavicoccus mobilis]AGA91404.1 diguanylate cyclase (GGDEF) domain-containing protein [Thioflavicoccus mobilis 8321]